MSQTRVQNRSREAIAPARVITCKASGAITGRTFVKVVSGGVGNHPTVATAGAGEKAFGIAEYDVASGGEVSVCRVGAYEVKFTNAAVTGGAEVEVGTTGFAKVLASGKSAGTLLADVAANGVGVVMFAS